jgi:hypothetical protein
MEGLRQPLKLYKDPDTDVSIAAVGLAFVMSVVVVSHALQAKQHQGGGTTDIIILKVEF